MDSGLWLILLVGVFLGFYLGRWRAENRRARFDQDRVWNGRKAYRDD
ncbi:MAG: hypothetical protein QOI50_2341 [Pseudonocardiales bacterium]|jgi:hypothetical protein|nr:hypothetical protein [Pseudonocardiales bacterium]MDT7586030.1 hypothetical protein [Pseudonocardiales bacterium]MDT7591994.1 hypothetical protein [Pseudonocardiales bacterium]MDT7606098.1 hypothetical protein [Pseudonocardiales bacterium]MDT7620040.1 hypothetical protein [Pseudonocardiales bacterium]